MNTENLNRLELCENKLPISQKVNDTMMQELNKINLYPDTQHSKLKILIAKHNCINSENVYIGNGSDEVILSVMLGLGIIEKKVIISSKSFMGYYFSSKLLKNEILIVDLKDCQIDVDTYIEKINITNCVVAAFICNPHNPFGTFIKYEELLKLIYACEAKGVYIVVDEAYVDFSDEYIEVISLIQKLKYLIVIKTFSKAYGLAGVRCGYACADKYIIDKLNNVKNALPYSVNRFALKAAEASMQDEKFLKRTVENNACTRLWFEMQLKEIGAQFIKSCTNFATIRVNDNQAVIDYFNRNLISVKDLSLMGVYDFVRITIGTKEDMKNVIDLIKKAKPLFVK